MRIIIASILASIIVAVLLGKWIRNRKLENEYYNEFFLIPNDNDLTQNDCQDNEQKEMQEVKKHKKVKIDKIEASKIIPFAQKAKTEVEAKFVLGQNNSAKVQYVLAKTREFEVQSYLITYPYLKASALIAICEKPALFDFEDIAVQECFTNAIKRVKLKKEHEVRIAKSKNYVIKRALLQRTNLSFEGFLEICKNPKHLNMSDDELFEKLEEIAKRLLPNLSSDEKLELATTKMDCLLNVLTE